MEPAGTNPPTELYHLGDSLSSNLAQNPQNVDDDVKHKLSPEQEAFFKDSKVRDENGNLKPVCHGTDAEFNQFDKNKLGEGLGHNPKIRHVLSSPL